MCQLPPNFMSLVHNETKAQLTEEKVIRVKLSFYASFHINVNILWKFDMKDCAGFFKVSGKINGSSCMVCI